MPHITVYGDAEEVVAPDRIVWYLNVTNKAAALKEVAEAPATGLRDNSAGLYSMEERTRGGSRWAIGPGKITLSTRVTVIDRPINPMST